MKPCKKTYKRELAIVMMLWLAYIVETKDVSIIEVLVWPVFTYVALSFGLDWFGKSGDLNRLRQSPKATNWRGDSSSGEYPSGEDEYPDSRDNK